MVVCSIIKQASAWLIIERTDGECKPVGCQRRSGTALAEKNGGGYNAKGLSLAQKKTPQ
jgi:hypothetical protein